MPKEEWGTKRLCTTTGKRFYDMNQTPIISPYTGEAVELDSTKTRMIAADAEDAVTAKAASAASDDDQVLDDDDVNVDLDDDLLDDDDEEEETVPLEEIADISTEDNVS